MDTTRRFFGDSLSKETMGLPVSSRAGSQADGEIDDGVFVAAVSSFALQLMSVETPMRTMYRMCAQ